MNTRPRCMYRALELHHSYQPIVHSSTGLSHAVEVFSYATSPDCPDSPELTPISMLGHPGLDNIDGKMFHSCLHAYQYAQRCSDELVFINMTTEQALLELLPEHLPFPDRTVIEITEHESMFNALIHSHMLLLSQHGVRFAVDDFGTGFSNLSFVLEHPFHFVKLDKLITDMAGRFEQNNIDQLHTIRSFVEGFHQAGLQVIAEGIESEDDCRRMKSVGCDLLQGYYFDRPSYLGMGNHTFALEELAQVDGLPACYVQCQGECKV